MHAGPAGEMRNMLNIRIICVGKFKEKYWEAASAEYMKRLGAYCSVSVTR